MLRWFVLTALLILFVVVPLALVRGSGAKRPANGRWVAALPKASTGALLERTP